MGSRLRNWLASLDRIHRAAIMLVALALIGFGAYRIKSMISVDRRVDEARAALDRGENSQARALLDACLKDRPNSGEVNYLAARASRRDGDLSRASEYLTKCTELGWPEDAIDFERTLLRVQQGEFREVEPILTEYLKSNPPPADADLVLEVIVPRYISEFDPRKALDLLENWIPRRPDDIRLRLWQYEAARWFKDWKTAIDALSTAVQMRPNDNGLRSQLAEQLLAVRRVPEAKPHFEALLAKDPRNRSYRLGMARCDREMGNTDAAIAQFDNLLKEEPQNPTLLAERGYCDLFAGRPHKALPLLLAAAERNPFEYDLLINLALCQEQCGNAAEAKRWRSKATSVSDDLQEMKNLSQSLGSRPRDPDLLTKGGTILARNGQWTEARRWLQMALRADPNHIKARKALQDLDTAVLMQGRTTSSP